MPTDAQRRATAKYVKENYDIVNLRLPKGKRAEFAERAKRLGYKSFNDFVRQAIVEKLNRGEK